MGGLFVTLPSLAILGLAVIWHRRLATMSGEIPGLPEQLTGADGVADLRDRARRQHRSLLGLVLALLLGPWSARWPLPPLALSLALGVADGPGRAGAHPRARPRTARRPRRATRGAADGCAWRGAGQPPKRRAQRLHVGDVLLRVVVHPARRTEPRPW